MAENNKQGFWNYLWEEGIKNNPVVNAITAPFNIVTGRQDDFVDQTEGAATRLTRGVNNVITNRDWGDENTTFEQAMEGQKYPKKTAAADSISLTPQPTLNDVAQQDVAQGGTDINQINVQGTSPSQTGGVSTDSSPTVPSGSFVDISKLEVKDLLETQKKEQEADEESGFETAWRRTKGVGNDIHNSVLSSALDSEKQANEKHLMLAYDPDSRDVTELVINEGQGYSDDFWNTLYGRGDGNREIFNDLLGQYQQGLYAIAYGEGDSQSKYAAALDLFNKFYDQVVDRKLLKAFNNDHYSDGFLWGALGGDMDFHGRLDNKFTKEQLDAASKRTIDVDTYVPSKDEFADFLDVYTYNNDLDDEFSLKGFYGEAGVPEGPKISINLTEESIAEMQSAQSEHVLEPVRVRIQELVDNGTITPGQGNKILQNMMSQTNNWISNMHFWLDTPLALGTMVKNKTEPLTDGERAVLGYLPGIEKFMEKYVDAVQRWELACLDNVTSDGIYGAPDMIDGMTIQEFFRNAIDDVNLQAGGIDLYSAESAIDAMQHINNNISYQYWKDKGNRLRRDWQEVQRIGGGVGYSAGELAQLGFNGILQGADYLVSLTGNESVISDYMLADMTSGIMVKTDVSDFGRLIGRFGTALLENGPEFWGELETMKLFFPENFKLKNLPGWLKGAKAVNKVEKLNKANKTVQKLSLIKKGTEKIRKSLGITATQVGGRNWVQRMMNGLLKSVEGENLITNNIIKIGGNITKGVVSDQVMDALVSYYDTEAYSNTSFLLSVGLTGLTEILAPLTVDSQIIKMIGNAVNGRDATSGTAWRVMSFLNTDETALKRMKFLFGDNLSLKTLRGIGKDWDVYEDIMEQAYNTLNKDGKLALDKFSKQVAFEQLRRLKNIDWQSSFGQELLRIINARDTNVADMFKLLFGITGEVEVGGFVSKILLKDAGKSLETRLLKQDYDIGLDLLDGGFRRRLKEGFSLEDIKELENKTQYKDLTKGGEPDEKLFSKEGDKYYLTSEGAKKFKLNVSEYTDAMRKADLRAASEKETKELLDEKTKQLMNNKGLTPETINRLASSGAFQKMVDNITEVVCKVK